MAFNPNNIPTLINKHMLGLAKAMVVHPMLSS
jgi:hypothetical protein